MSAPIRIGTVEILRQRIYSLDAESHDDTGHPEQRLRVTLAIDAVRGAL